MAGGRRLQGRAMTDWGGACLRIAFLTPAVPSLDGLIPTLNVNVMFSSEVGPDDNLAAGVVAAWQSVGDAGKVGLLTEAIIASQKARM